MIRRFSYWIAISLAGLVTTAAAAQQAGCVYNRAIYPEGSETCRSGTLVRCEEGAWADIGLCDEAPPLPPPRAGGGDVVIEERPRPRDEN